MSDAALAKMMAERDQQDADARRIYDQQIASGETARFFRDGTKPAHDYDFDQTWYGRGPAPYDASTSLRRPVGNARRMAESSE